ncbi:MAG: SoxR reducing system RseC family protein [Thiotrichales bacterium]|nr:SoxR reducing system RseC family protein [Thiotrichales bacterium]
MKSNDPPPSRVPVQPPPPLAQKPQVIERAEVIGVEGDRVWVQLVAKGCQGCGQSGSCGTSALANLFARPQQKALCIPNRLGAKLGDQVDLSLDESRLVKYSALAYGLPLILFFGGALLLQWLAQASAAAGWHAVNPETFAVLGAFSGLILGWWLSRFWLAPVTPQICAVFPLQTR